MSRDIHITAEPVDATRCRFVVSEPLYPGGVRRFTAPDQAPGSPLAEHVYGIPGAGIRQVIVSDSQVTVVKDTATPWQEVGRQVGQAIRAALAVEGPPVAAKAVPAGSGTGDDVLYDRVAELFREQVNPMVARHGGRVELIDVQDARVMLRLSGGCQGCGMADVTLRQGIEGMLAQFVPEVQGVVDITNHSAGDNPYYSAAQH
jgi:Fe-S cluster biogenesis protein NfuA